MSELLTAAQMGAIEQAAIAGGEVTGLELMERAGAGVVEAIFNEWPEMAKGKRKAVVLCGPGNNGGDGFVIARLLNGKGWRVEVFLYGDAAKLPSDAKANCGRWLETGSITPLTAHTADEWASNPPDLIIEALFGTGLTRALPPSIASVFQHIPPETKVVAVDMPAGIHTDSGKALHSGERANEHCRAGLTVTFHAAKLGHHLADGPQACGKLALKSIGLPFNVPSILPPEAPTLVEVTASNRSALKKTTSAHKFQHGHALILSGPAGKGGAARLAARGALRIGAGCVTIGAPSAAMVEHATQLDAIMLCEVEDDTALIEVLRDERINALCLGPGLTLMPQTKAQIHSALAAQRSTVLDASALSVFADDPDALLNNTHNNVVLTPHEGEFARLFPDVIAEYRANSSYSKVDATRAAAKRAGCVVLFKGADTVIAAPSGRCAINSAHYDRVAPWLATAGSGDVLAGFITGLLARGFAPFEAAQTGAWLHVECALRFGPGLIAEDLPEQLPKVFRAIGL